MPLLQYKCPVCGEYFEEIKKSTDRALCPKCGATAERSYSGEMFSATGKTIKKCSGNCKNCDGCK